VRYCHGRCWIEETSDRFDDDHLVPDDRGSCKGPLLDCRRIVIRLRYGIKGRSGRGATNTGESAWLTYTRIGPLTPSLRRIGRQQSVRWGEGRDHGPRARCVPDRAANRGDSRSLPGSLIHRLTCVQAGRPAAQTDLPSRGSRGSNPTGRAERARSEHQISACVAGPLVQAHDGSIRIRRSA
jgi:hypothetical protein